MTGVFITFEGTEGSGKSTQIQILAERLRQAGVSVVVCREPGGTGVGEEIRAILKRTGARRSLGPETELLLMNASRAQLVREVIRPSLDEGKVVLCDRFFDSTVAYQAFGRGIEQGRVGSVIDLATGGTRPDLTLLLLLPVEASEARRRSRRQGGAEALDRFEQSDREFFERVEAGYREVARTEPARVRTVDATRPISEVAAAIWAEVEPWIGGGAGRATSR